MGREVTFPRSKEGSKPSAMRLPSHSLIRSSGWTDNLLFPETNGNLNLDMAFLA